MSLQCSELSCPAKVCCWTVTPTQSWSHPVSFSEGPAAKSCFPELLQADGISWNGTFLPQSSLCFFPAPCPPLCHSPLLCSCPLRPRQSWGRRAFPVSILLSAVLQDADRKGLPWLHKQSISFIALVACFFPPELTVVPLIALLPQVSPKAVLIELKRVLQRD